MSFEARANLYQQLDPTLSIAADDQERYVDWQARLGGEDVKSVLVHSVVMGGPTHHIRFLTGHRGNGKTSELLRVKARLESGGAGKKVFVSFLKGEDWLDLENVDARDVVYQIVRQLSTDLGERGMSFARERFRAWFDELSKELSGLHAKGISVGGEPFKVDLAFKESTSLRAELRKLIDPRLPTLYDLINDVIGRAREWLAQPQHGGFQDILVIVDELDRMPPFTSDDDERRVNRHERLFVENAGKLRGFACDVIYTLPPALAFSTSVKQLMSAYGGAIEYLPGIPVRSRAGAVLSEGEAVMRDILARRVRAAGLEWAAVFPNDDAVERLIGASGGYIRTMLQLARSALDRTADGGTTIDRGGLERAIRLDADMIVLGLSDADWAILDAVHASKAKPGDEADAARFYKLLHAQYVHIYHDDAGYWFDRTPLLASRPEAAA